MNIVLFRARKLTKTRKLEKKGKGLEVLQKRRAWVVWWWLEVHHTASCN